MKKLLLGLICASLVLFTTACSQPKAGGDTGSAESSEVAVGQTQVVFGKISAITGNEIKFSLAKDPYAEVSIPEGDGGNGATTGAVDAVGLAPAGEGTPEDMPKMELDYTGESKDYVIPAGIKILGIGGNEEQLSALKKGSVLMMFEEIDTGTVTEISIME